MKKYKVRWSTQSPIESQDKNQGQKSLQNLRAPSELFDSNLDELPTKFNKKEPELKTSGSSEMPQQITNENKVKRVVLKDLSRENVRPIEPIDVSKAIDQYNKGNHK